MRKNRATEGGPKRDRALLDSFNIFLNL